MTIDLTQKVVVNGVESADSYAKLVANQLENTGKIGDKLIDMSKSLKLIGYSEQLKEKGIVTVEEADLDFFKKVIDNMPLIALAKANIYRAISKAEKSNNAEA